MADFRKDPADVLDYIFNWTKYLAAGESIDSYELSITGGGVIDSHSEANNIITAFVSGGTLGKIITLSCKITTDSSPARTKVQSITIKVASG